MNELIVTIDLDWACEAAIEEVLVFLQDKKICPTVFVTHHSKIIEACMNDIDVGLHPVFGEKSSHGTSINEVTRHIMELPHNLPAFRCHRFAVCNLSLQAMTEAGMLISSNVCTDLAVVAPFINRFGLLEVPIFLEDGGYLWQKHDLDVNQTLLGSLAQPGQKVIIIHPMHFAVNTPCFAYMRDIKQAMSYKCWRQMSKSSLDALRWPGRGIRDLTIDLLSLVPQTMSLRALYHNVLKQRNLSRQLPE
jgi:hypothetical protein